MKRYPFLSVALTALLMAALVAACGEGPASIVSPDQATASPTQGDEERERTAVPTAESEKEKETVAPTPAPPTNEATTNPAPTPEETEVESPSKAEHVVQLAREDLAQRLSLAPEAIALVSVKAVDWPDTSLGCPEPGMGYAQVITQGFRVVLAAGRQRYEYHADTARLVVLCGEDELHIVPLMPVAPHGIPGKPRVPSD